MKYQSEKNRLIPSDFNINALNLLSKSRLLNKAFAFQKTRDDKHLVITGIRERWLFQNPRNVNFWFYPSAFC